jgi:hypothetical protein
MIPNVTINTNSNSTSPNVMNNNPSLATGAEECTPQERVKRKESPLLSAAEATELEISKKSKILQVPSDEELVGSDPYESAENFFKAGEKFSEHSERFYIKALEYIDSGIQDVFAEDAIEYRIFGIEISVNLLLYYHSKKRREAMLPLIEDVKKKYLNESDTITRHHLRFFLFHGAVLEQSKNPIDHQEAIKLYIHTLELIYKDDREEDFNSDDEFGEYKREKTFELNLRITSLYLRLLDIDSTKSSLETTFLCLQSLGTQNNSGKNDKSEQVIRKIYFILKKNLKNVTKENIRFALINFQKNPHHLLGYLHQYSLLELLKSEGREDENVIFFYLKTLSVEHLTSDEKKSLFIQSFNSMRSKELNKKLVEAILSAAHKLTYKEKTDLYQLFAITWVKKDKEEAIKYFELALSATPRDNETVNIENEKIKVYLKYKEIIEGYEIPKEVMDSLFINGIHAENSPLLNMEISALLARYFLTDFKTTKDFTSISFATSYVSQGFEYLFRIPVSPINERNYWILIKELWTVYNEIQKSSESEADTIEKVIEELSLQKIEEMRLLEELATIFIWQAEQESDKNKFEELVVQSCLAIELAARLLPTIQETDDNKSLLKDSHEYLCLRMTGLCNLAEKESAKDHFNLLENTLKKLSNIALIRRFAHFCLGNFLRVRDQKLEKVEPIEKSYKEATLDLILVGKESEIYMTSNIANFFVLRGKFDDAAELYYKILAYYSHQATYDTSMIPYYLSYTYAVNKVDPYAFNPKLKKPDLGSIRNKGEVHAFVGEYYRNLRLQKKAEANLQREIEEYRWALESILPLNKYEVVSYYLAEALSLTKDEKDRSEALTILTSLELSLEHSNPNFSYYVKAKIAEIKNFGKKETEFSETQQNEESEQPPSYSSSNSSSSSWSQLGTAAQKLRSKVFPLRNTSNVCFMNSIFQIIVQNPIQKEAIVHGAKKALSERGSLEVKNSLEYLVEALEGYEERSSEIDLEKLRPLVPQAIFNGNHDAAEFREALFRLIDRNKYPQLFFNVGIDRKYKVFTSESVAEEETQANRIQEFIRKGTQVSRMPQDLVFKHKRELDFQFHIETQSVAVDLSEELNSLFEFRKPISPSEPTIYEDFNGKLVPYEMLEERHCVEGNFNGFSARIKLFRVDENFNMSKRDVSIEAPFEIRLGSNTYELCSCVIHMGTLNAGHYVSLIKINNHWVLCNDSSIEILELHLVRRLLAMGFLFDYQLKTSAGSQTKKEEIKKDLDDYKQ